MAKEYTDMHSFRYCLICSTLSGHAVRFKDVRIEECPSGLREEEVAFLKLLQSISNGCVVELTSTGCYYKPGLIVGGIVNFCQSTKRNVSYFLEPLLLLGLFGKKALNVTIEGVTHDDVDPSADVLRAVTLPTIAKLCDIESGLEMRVIKRGAPPNGGGKVQLLVPVIRQIPSVQWTDEGMVKRIRGVAYALKVSPQFTNRMVHAARGMLNAYLSDVYIFTDAVRGKESGESPGYGMHLVAETTTGCLISSNVAASSETASRPEDVGSYGAAALLEEIERGGVVDSIHQKMILLLCVLGPELLSEVRFGPLAPQAVFTLRLLRDFFGVVFNVRPEKEHGTVFLSCVGIGLKNFARKIA